MQVNTALDTQPAAQISSQQNLGSKNIFLKILVAQLQNQDPLKPQDAAQMSTQLAQFNMVEQQIKTNKLLTGIAAGSTSTDTQAATAAAWLGHQAVINGNQLKFDGATPENIVVQAPESAADATVQVLDARGQVVKTLYSGSLSNDTTQLTWDGNRNTGGQAAAGDYSVTVKATNADGLDITANTQVIGQVQAVRITTSGVELVVGGVPVSMADVQEVRL